MQEPLSLALHPAVPSIPTDNLPGRRYSDRPILAAGGFLRTHQLLQPGKPVGFCFPPRKVGIRRRLYGPAVLQDIPAQSADMDCAASYLDLVRRRGCARGGGHDYNMR
jgi:hypothetical protein